MIIIRNKSLYFQEANKFKMDQFQVINQKTNKNKYKKDNQNKKYQKWKIKNHKYKMDTK